MRKIRRTAQLVLPFPREELFARLAWLQSAERPLKDRQEWMVTAYFGSSTRPTMTTIGRSLGISNGRVSTILRHAISRLANCAPSDRIEYGYYITTHGRER